MMKRATYIALLIVLFAPALAAFSQTRSLSDDYVQARTLYDQQRYQEALDLITGTIAVEPKPAFRVLQAYCLFRLGDEFGGLSIFREVLSEKDLDKEQKATMQDLFSSLSTSAQKASFRVALQDNTGQPVVSAGRAHVFVDGALQEGDESRLVVGNHIVRVEGKGFVREKKIFIKPNERSVWKVMIPMGIISIPKLDGGALYVDTESVTAKAGTVWVTPGARLVAVRREGRQVFVRQLSLEPGERHALSLQPMRPVGALAPSPLVRRSQWGLITTGGILTVTAIVLHALAANEFSAMGSPNEAGVVTGGLQAKSFQGYDSGTRNLSAARYLYAGGGLSLLSGLIWYLATPAP